MIIEIIILTTLIEIITIIARKLKLNSYKIQKDLGLKVHIHHMYIGIALLIINFFFQKERIFIIGISLIISDLIHHFIVLPLWIKKTAFP